MLLIVVCMLIVYGNKGLFEDIAKGLFEDIAKGRSNRIVCGLSMQDCLRNSRNVVVILIVDGKLACRIA